MDPYRGLNSKTRRDKQRRKGRKMRVDGRSVRLIPQIWAKRAEKLPRPKNRQKS